MKTLSAALFVLAPLCGLAQAPVATAPSPDQAKVSVTSRGSDIRLVLTNIFSQAKKSLILQPTIQYSLYLSLQDTDFSKAVEVICDQAGLKFDIRDGIYHIYRKKAPLSFPTLPKVAAPAAATPSVEEPMNSKPTVTPAISEGPKTGRLSLLVLKRKVTTKLAKAPIGAVLEELGAQSGIKIELGENVPAYRLDAVLNHTTLRYALEQITRAAKLTYSFTDHRSILVDTRS
jgi:hypothetical protein